ncbi:Gfo/Idh/MocA family oxidoreductase [Haloarculaceae archaeon H-GB2-1]|nr:Gfo/Idh/MocA family oxidoreductase [Haloarculaceae archaeon H-GB1-1]MEA5406336.1 Gfo/Idh/MocA family oxidoreductase [Haloarculaceae archaeon H-GB2-1]
MNFGVLSTAHIGTGSVIPAMQASDHQVLAIASRDGERAAAAAENLDIPRSYGSYEDLLADGDLDAVYNPLPNGLHAEWTKRAADAGLAVLCEKPLASDAAEARTVFDHCEERGVTVMEAFMYRFDPRMDRALDLVRNELGEVRSVDAHFSFRIDDEQDIRLQPDLDGGSVMDVGCYAISAARQFLGEPQRVFATTTDTRDCGVDTSMAGVLEVAGGATARVSSGFDTTLQKYVRVGTTDGWLRIEPAFYVDPDVTTTIEYGVGGRTVTETFDPVDYYRLEVEAFADAVDAGRAPPIDRAETLANMAVIDAVYDSAVAGEPIHL